MKLIDSLVRSSNYCSIAAQPKRSNQLQARTVI